MVRLKAMKGLSTSPGAIFQFQYGTIKSFVSICQMLPFFDFNSSMVRLKENENIKRHSERRDFNSSMVRLKEPDGSTLTTSTPNFNSSMVRLKVN